MGLVRTLGPGSSPACWNIGGPSLCPRGLDFMAYPAWWGIRTLNLCSGLPHRSHSTVWIGLNHQIWTRMNSSGTWVPLQRWRVHEMYVSSRICTIWKYCWQWCSRVPRGPRVLLAKDAETRAVVFALEVRRDSSGISKSLLFATRLRSWMLLTEKWTE